MVTSEMRQPPLRLTRRGRVVVLGFFIVMASIASAILLTTASRADDPHAGAPATVIVQPDDTLWSIAARTAPETDRYAAIARLREINNLQGYVVHPGQTLELPRSR